MLDDTTLAVPALGNLCTARVFVSCTRSDRCRSSQGRRPHDQHPRPVRIAAPHSPWHRRFLRAVHAATSRRRSR